MVEKFCAEAKKLEPAATKPDEVMVDIEDENESDKDDGGLEFIDPEEVRKAELAEAAKNKDQN